MDIASYFLKVIANTLFVSIPEEILPMAFCLILLKRFNLFDMNKLENKVVFHKENVIKFLIPVIFSALISDILRYSGVDIDFVSTLSILTMIYLTVVIYKIHKLMEILKTFVFTVLGGLVLLTMEIVYVPLIENATGKSLSQINNSILLNSIYSLPPKLIYFAIITYVIIKKIDFLKINLIKVIAQSKAAVGILSFLIIMDFAYVYWQWKAICIDRILMNYSVLTQLAHILFVIAFPLLNMLGVWIIIHIIESYKAFKALLIKNKLRSLTEALETFYNNGQYEKIGIAIKDIKKNIEGIGE